MNDRLDFLAGGGEMGALIRAKDWSLTPLGPAREWPQSLRSAISILLPSKAQIVLFWGPDLIALYNDAYRPVFGDKHPQALGQPVREAWSELWRSVLQGLFEGVLATGEAYWAKDRPFLLERHGYPEETFFDVSYDPVRDESGAVGGVFCIVNETTGRVLGERRLRVLRDLAAEPAEARSAEAACTLCARVLASDPEDVPFALIYLFAADGAQLAATAGVERGQPVSPEELGLSGGAWPLAGAQLVEQLERRFAAVPRGPWDQAPTSAMVLPLARGAQERPFGAVVLGISARRAFDEEYRGFFALVAGQVAASLANARASEAEHQRAEALAELDRAKTTFFSNVSHEFRTPLTLMLGPTEDALADTVTPLSPLQRERLELAQRSALRLQKLVNTLLDYARIEAGRAQARFVSTDLAALTADLASSFRSAVEKAGLVLTVDCPALPQAAYVDRDMWEKIVLNLLSNALKFTFEGEIAVRLRQAEGGFELAVRDTGTGIPAAELPHLFERFRRVEGARSRAHEGSGIGLALVRELVRLHGGTVAVESVYGAGTTFTVCLPEGRAHLPADAPRAERALAPTALGAAPFVEEAQGWLAGARQAETAATGPRSRIVWADDNADMREYVRRLLSPTYEVETVSDGAAALAAVRAERPDLVLADVMMPRLDGFGLLAALRSDEATRTLPVILLSARAGEEARVEGMGAGADDYLVKPFSAKELLARVAARLEIARLRRETELAAREREEHLRLALSAGRLGSWQLERAGMQFLCSAQCKADFGRGPDDPFTYGQFRASLHPDDRARVEAALDRALFVLGAFEAEFRCVWPDGTTRWIHARGRALADEAGLAPRMLGVTLDVTERKLAELALQQRTAQFKTLLDQAPLGVYLVDADFRMREINPIAEPVFGDIEGGAVGRDFAEVLHLMLEERDADEMVRRFRHTLATGEPHVTAEQATLRIARKKTTFYEWRIDRIPLPDGRHGVVCYFRDISVHVSARKALEESREALREADRRKDEFLATLAHELRNPLAPIRNAVHLLGLKASDETQLRWSRSIIDRQVTHLTRLIDDLLDAGRIAHNRIELRKEAILLADCIAAAVETSLPNIEQRGHQLAVSLPPEAVYLEGDLIRLAQVFMNLLTNAAKYTERPGRIELSARVAAEGDPGARQIVVRVKDTGVGIARENLPRVFDMFFQVDRSLENSQSGLGIGLSLVREVIALHSGSIAVESAGLGQGSEFVVRLPIMAAGVRPSVLVPFARRKAAVSPRRILVVDDVRDSAESLAMLLRLSGHEVHTAHDGLEALEVAERIRPDVTLLDIGMPALNGYDVCRRLRAEPWGRSTLLIALTGWGGEEDRRKSSEAGFDGHLVKPVDPAAVEELLQSPLRSPVS